MRLEKIKSEELKRQVALRAGKLSFKDVTEDDLDQISEITLNVKSLSGEITNIEFNILEIFPCLKKVRVIGFDISQDELDIISRLACIEVLEFSKCKFDEVSFESIEGKLKRIDFSECGELAFKYPKMKNILVNMCILDFENINLEDVHKICVIGSIIKNLPDLSKYLNLKIVNFDGSKILDENGKEIIDISIPENIEYSYKDSVEKIDKTKNVKKTIGNDDRGSKCDKESALML